MCRTLCWVHRETKGVAAVWNSICRGLEGQSYTGCWGVAAPEEKVYGRAARAFKGTAQDSPGARVALGPGISQEGNRNLGRLLSRKEV